jgi:hypothetical protein
MEVWLRLRADCEQRDGGVRSGRLKVAGMHVLVDVLTECIGLRLT